MPTPTSIVDQAIENAFARGVSNAIFTIRGLKEPLLRKLIAGQDISEKESGYLDALTDAENALMELD